MKRFLTLMMILMAMPHAMHAADAASNVPSVKIFNLISEYRGNDGFEVVRLGNLATMLTRSVINAIALNDMDEEIAVVRQMIGGIRKISVVDYEEAEPAIGAEFSRKVARALKSTDIIMEAKDEESTVRMYGDVSADGRELRDFILFCPEDCVLIIIRGTLSTDAIAKLTE